MGISIISSTEILIEEFEESLNPTEAVISEKEVWNSQSHSGCTQ